ncbi:hypothetical protein JXA63_03795 [Candidatus Woesebacteria bacterium]|nr:hypothetical protein [Candidatus Woesebacteria bacterium]
MNSGRKITVTNHTKKDGYVIFSLSILDKGGNKSYKIYVSDDDYPIKDPNTTQEKIYKFAEDEMVLWLKDLDNNLPKDKYRILVNKGKISTNDINSFLTVQEKSSDLVRTNVTISAPLFEWAKDKAKKEDTSFSDLVSRGLLTLKNSDKEVLAWYKEQNAYFKKKLGNFGSFEVFHYLPDGYEEFTSDRLMEVLRQSEIRRTGWPIGACLTGDDMRPRPQPDGIKAEYEPEDYLKLDYWYAKNKGEFYFARNLESDSGNGPAKPNTVLYFDTLIWRVSESLEHCIKFYTELGIDEKERIKVKMTLDGLNGRSLSAWNPGRAFSLRHYTCGSDKSTWETTDTSLKGLQDNLDETIYDAAKKLLVMFDFFVPNKDVVSDIVHREYRKSSLKTYET